MLRVVSFLDGVSRTLWQSVAIEARMPRQANDLSRYGFNHSISPGAMKRDEP
jgi:hypothetical protein